VTETAADTRRNQVGLDDGDDTLHRPTIRVAHFVAGETGVIKVAGHLDAANAAHVERALDRFTGRRVRRMRRLVLDLAAVTFIDEAGFRPIDSVTRAHLNSVAIEIIEPSPPVRQFFARIGRVGDTR
jgi:anti-anti-sigma factor